jgi:hypothetical protein
MQESYANGQNPTDPVTQGRQRSLDKRAAERALMEEQAEEHRLNEQIRAETKKEELDALLAKAPKDGAFWIRMIAAEHMLTRGGAVLGNDKQIQYDDVTIAIARYAIEGRV